MNKLPVFVGLDYHQSTVQICVVDSEGQVLLKRSTENDFLSIVERVEHCGRVVRVGIEACCGSANLAEELVNQAGWIVDLAHPGYVARMKQSPDKTDFSDARMIADLERVGYLPRVWLAPQPIRELRQLVHYRQQLANERRNVKLRICALLREHRVKRPSGRRWTLAWFAWLRQLTQLNEHSRWILDQHLARLASLGEAICAVEARLTDTTRDDGVVQHLLALPGIGPITAWMLRAEIGRFDRFQTGKQLSRFCGLSPRNASSGARQADAGLIRAGNPALRAVLIQAAHRLINGNEKWGAFADRLLAKGKPKSVVAAAVARVAVTNRWVRWLFHQMQPETQAA